MYLFGCYHGCKFTDFFVNWAFVPPKISAFLMAFSVILSDGVGRGDSERGRVVVVDLLQ